MESMGASFMRLARAGSSTASMSTPGGRRCCQPKYTPAPVPEGGKQMRVRRGGTAGPAAVRGVVVPAPPLGDRTWVLPAPPLGERTWVLPGAGVGETGGEASVPLAGTGLRGGAPEKLPAVRAGGPVKLPGVRDGPVKLPPVREGALVKLPREGVAV